jgi:5-oxoprolinase (ATP-hydrolysing) subunit A
MGDDDALVPLVSSVNVACGAHAGDPSVMQRTVELAKLRHGATIGAHPGYPDRDGFGRREIALSADELRASLLYQLGALDAFCRAAGCALRHVKPHGALYNRAANDAGWRRDPCAPCTSSTPGWCWSGWPAQLARSRPRAGLAVAAEAFADRAYEPDGSLRSRRLPGAVLARPRRPPSRRVDRHPQPRRAHDGTTIEIAPTRCASTATRPAPPTTRARCARRSRPPA